MASDYDRWKPEKKGTGRLHAVLCVVIGAVLGWPPLPLNALSLSLGPPDKYPSPIQITAIVVAPSSARVAFVDAYGITHTLTSGGELHSGYAQRVLMIGRDSVEIEFAAGVLNRKTGETQVKRWRCTFNVGDTIDFHRSFDPCP